MMWVYLWGEMNLWWNVNEFMISSKGIDYENWKVWLVGTVFACINMSTNARTESRLC